MRPTVLPSKTVPNRLRSRSARARGLTLLEILVALLILAGSLLSLAKFDGLITQAYSEAEQRSEAIFLAQQCIEELRAFDHSVTLSGTTGAMCGSAGLVNGTHATSVTGTSATFSRSWTATPRTGPTRTDLTVTVAWTDSSSTARSVVLSSTTYPNNPVHSVEWIMN